MIIILINPFSLKHYNEVIKKLSNTTYIYIRTKIIKHTFVIGLVRTASTVESRTSIGIDFVSN